MQSYKKTAVGDEWIGCNLCNRNGKNIYFCCMEIKVFKFGGASVNSAKGVINVASIIRRFPDHHLVLVISAMGKTTNALEELLNHYMSDDPVPMIEAFYRIRDYHLNILKELHLDRKNRVFTELESLFEHLRGYLRNGHLIKKGAREYNFEYDQVVSYGERISSAIIHRYLESSGIRSRLFDAADLICTDDSFRDAGVDWENTVKAIRSKLGDYFSYRKTVPKVAVLQGFIGSDPAGNTTTLGREGSDYTAAIVAYALKTKEVTIWKDVPGVMNADPKWLRNVRKLDSLSYLEAIELAYYGASVIHPKTIKPLENANITLHVRSFLKPEAEGTIIENIPEWKVGFPIYIRKQNQVLISVSPRDFSFIVEENLCQIFEILAHHHVKVNVMQNSAISFSFCVDEDLVGVEKCLSELRENYTVRYNNNLELFTLRHYNQRAINRIIKGRTVLMEQKTRNTYHLLVQ